MLMPFALLAVFALLTAAGIGWIVDERVGRRAAILSAAATLAGFAALAAFVVWLVSTA